MAINGQIGNPTNLSNQDGSSVLSFEELGHGQANNYLPTKKGKFLITGTEITSSVASVSIQAGLNQATLLDVQFISLKPQNDNDSLRMQFYENGSLQTGAVYDRATYSQNSSNTVAFNHSTNDTGIELKECGNATNEEYNGNMYIFHAKDSTRQTNFLHKGFAINSSGALVGYQVWGELPQASLVDGIKIFFSSGNIESGKIKIYGYG
jgi:hypothetical protein